jgi:hypothetical protein
MTDARTTADEQAAAFYASLDPARVQLERAASLSPIEVRMLGNVR